MATITEEQKQKAISRHVSYSKSLRTPEALLESVDSMDFTDVCTTRNILEKEELTEHEASLVKASDERLRHAFNEEVLQLYAEYNAQMPVREWWG